MKNLFTLKIGLILFIVVMLINSCASMDYFKKGGTGLEEKEISVKGPKRGVVIDFIDGKPGNVIYGNSVVGLGIANYGQNIENVRLNVWDTNKELKGFNGVVDMSVPLKSAIFDKGEFSGPGITKYNLDIFNYQNVVKGSKTQFIAEIEYDYQSNVQTNFCITNPDGEKAESCDLQETLSGERLSHGAKLDPITITNIKKDIVGYGPTDVSLTLDISISNMGGGKIMNQFSDEKKDIIKFDVYSDYEMNCNSENLVDVTYNVGDFGEVFVPDEGELMLPFNLELDNGKAIVTCTTVVPIDSPLKNMGAKVIIDYGYKYTTSTGEIEIKG